MSTYIGIDCGLNGGIGIITDKRIFGVPMPTFWTTLKSGKRRKEYNYLAIRQILEAHKSDFLKVTLEEQFPLPISRTNTKTGKEVKQGAVSIFSTGFGYGMFIGMLCGMDVTTDTVHPKTWQKEFFKRDTSKTTKEQALEAVRMLFPDTDLFATERSTKPNDGIVDAILIAEWGRRKAMGELKK
jgi:hypothetical protein